MEWKNLDKRFDLCPGGKRGGVMRSIEARCVGGLGKDIYDNEGE